MTLIEQFQEILKRHKISAYIIPTADFHLSEYISDYFKERQFLSNFTGSAGTLIVTTEKAYLWADGRYFIQAERQIKGTGITLMKMGNAGVPSILEFLKTNLTKEDTLAFYAKMLPLRDYLTYTENLECKIEPTIDLVDELWEERPTLPTKMLYSYNEYYAGKSASEKIKQVREKMRQENVTYYVLSALEDEAWLFNLRGDDIAHTPVFLAYTIISFDDVYLFVDENKINPNVEHLLNDLNVKVKDYDEIYHFLTSVSKEHILLDKAKTNMQIYLSLKDKNTIIFKQNPTLLLKSIKNEAEIMHTKEAHIIDGVAVTKLMYWLKNNIGKNEMSELSVSNYLEELRKKGENFLDLSFNTICAYKDNAAMMHYSATEESNAALKPEGMLLIDSGGQYLTGTTDITRTYSLGGATSEEKKYFTTVLASLIDLADTIFLKGLTGLNLDIRAREPIWKLLIDYKCGTGHGVGHLLAVHEGPNNFHSNIANGIGTPLTPGMITTDEPGIYLEGKLGIRLENELLCKEITTNEWGTFYGFETITLAPIDLDLVDPAYLTKNQINWLNNYHAEVYNKISPFLEADEKEWLKKYTKAI